MPFIYALADPITNDVFYVGKAREVGKRLYHHIWEAKTRRETGAKSDIIRKILSIGLVPNVIVIKEVTENEWKEQECACIQLYKDMGFELTNIAPGGGAYPLWTGKHHSEETKLKIKLALAGKPGKKGARGKMKNPCQRPRWDKGLIGRGGKKVNQYSSSGELLGTYNSTKHAAINTGASQCNVSRCCTGKLKQTKGFIFRYAEQDVR